MLDYTKLKWHDGAPDKLEVGMVLDHEDFFDSKFKEFWVVGDVNECGSYTPGNLGFIFPTHETKRWAWLPGFEKE